MPSVIFKTELDLINHAIKKKREREACRMYSDRTIAFDTQILLI